MGGVRREGSPYTVGDDPLSLNSGDFNGDGRPDVATINGSSSDVSVFLRQAGGGFAQEAGSPISLGANSGPERRGGRRLQRRRALDLAVSTFNRGGTVGVLLRQSGGGFAIEGGPVSPGQGRLTRIAAGDFNGDGGVDLAVTTAAASSSSCRATPRTPASPWGTRSRPARPRSRIAVGDYNGDGLSDLAIANRGSDNVTVLRRSGGTFVAEAARSVGDDPDRHRRRRLRRQRPRRFRGDQRRHRQGQHLPAQLGQHRLLRRAADRGQRRAGRHRRRRSQPRRPA